MSAAISTAQTFSNGGRCDKLSRVRELRGPSITLRLLVESEELLAMEGEYDGDGAMPPPHLHPRQDEHFQVLDGAIRTVIDGVEQRFERGDEFDVPAGTVHQMAAIGPSRVRWEVRPALRTAEFFTRLYAGDVGPTFLDDFAEEFRLVPPDG